MHRSPAVLAVAALLAAGPAAAEVLLETTGRLGRGDPTLPDGSYYASHRVSVTAGDRLVVVLESTEFDPCLRVTLPDGALLSNDDRAPGDPNSRVEALVPVSGWATIEANTLFGGAEGAYRLRAERFAGAPAGPAAVSASPAGEGPWIVGRLEPGDRTHQDGSYIDLHPFRGRAGERVTIRLESDAFDPYLFLTGPDGFLESNDDADGKNSRITATLPADGEYTAIVNSYGAGPTPGAYRLRIDRGRAEAVVEAPVDAPAVAVGEVRRGTLGAGDATLSDGSWYDVFSLRGRAGQAIAIRLESDEFDPVLLLTGPDGFTDGNDDADGRNSRLETVLPADGEYAIGVNAYRAGAGGAYVLRIGEGAGGAAATGAPLRLGRPVEGALGEGDETIASGEFFDVYVLEARAGEAIAIDLESGEFDPYLMVRGPGGFSEDNDDFARSRTRSRIEFTPPADGIYRVGVTSYRPGETGRYRIVAAPPGAERAEAAAVVAAAATEARPLRRGAWTEGRLGPASGVLETGERRDVWTFEGRRGERLAVEMTSTDLDAYLFVRGPGVSLDNDDAADGVRDARIEMVLPAEGTYRVVATTYRPGEEGAYRIRLADDSVRAAPERPAPPGGAPPVGESPRVWGIFVGVSDYPPGIADLDRCADDARKIAEVLRDAGVSPADGQRVLLDGAATVSGVRRAFAEIAPRVGPDDVFVFFFSGHGTQSEDRPSSAERDRREESIVLHDGEIADDSLGALLAGVRGRLALVAVDACFSGGLRDALTRPDQMGVFSSEEDLTSAVPEKFQAGGFLSHFLREGLLGRADADGDDRVTAGELSEYLHRRYAAEVSGVEAETLEGLPSYQHLVVDRGGVKVNDLLLSLAQVPARSKFHVVPTAGVRGGSERQRTR